MTNEHPIIPPASLLDGWFHQHYGSNKGFSEILIEVAQWGADQELEACCEVLARELICDGKHVATDLCMIRRPKPPSLKEQALNLLEQHAYGWTPAPNDWDLIRRALEQLDD